MGTLDDVAAMRREGKNEQEILELLKQRGLSDREISSVLTQNKIKDAVVGEESMEAPTPSQYSEETQEEYSGMSPSLMSPNTSPPAQTEQQYSENYPQQETQEASYSQSPQAYSDYGYQPQYSASAAGSDLIAEIADQVVTEKLSTIVAGVDKLMDMRSSVESQLKNLDERLKRIEKIIDRLQLSLLQRVGEYVSNVEDIKREMVETQKTFKSLVDNK